MAKEEHHISAANVNQQTIEHLCLDVNKFGSWVAVVAFYKALHIVEAVFANDSNIQHTSDHPTREHTLKTTHKYKEIYKHYALLSRAATIARYLEYQGQECPCFYDYLPPHQIIGELVLHRLNKVEASAENFMKTAGSLSRVVDRREAIVANQRATG